jgi:hypothetical protein
MNRREYPKASRSEREASKNFRNLAAHGEKPPRSSETMPHTARGFQEVQKPCRTQREASKKFLAIVRNCNCSKLKRIKKRCLRMVFFLVGAWWFLENFYFKIKLPFLLNLNSKKYILSQLFKRVFATD